MDWDGFLRLNSESKNYYNSLKNPKIALDLKQFKKCNYQ